MAPLSVNGVALTDAGELALVTVNEDLAATVLARPSLAFAFGFGLRAEGADDVAILDLDVPLLGVGDYVDIRHDN
jgi:hypothetical protein